MPRYDLECTACKKEFLDVIHSIHDTHPVCDVCGKATQTLWTIAPGVTADDIPGGLEVKHGICNPDGTPKKYYSKSEIRKAAFEAGFTIHGETPKRNPRLQDAEAAAKEAKSTH